MKSLKTYLVEKEWDDFVKGSFVVDGIDRIPARNKKIAFAYTNLERAKKDVENLNKECLQCPRRAALHTAYTVLPNAIYTRMLIADEPDETYESKSKIMSMSREQIGVNVKENDKTQGK